MSDLSEVYILTDNENRIIAIEGGYSSDNIKNIAEWVQIDSGAGDRYNLCQTHYLPTPLTDENGVYRYRYCNGVIEERTATEMEQDLEPQQFEMPTQLDRMEAQLIYTALMTDTLLEV